jgi:hypothetical protein
LTTEHDNLIRKFLLNQLPEDQRVQFEERMFREDALFADVRATAEELADECVSGELTGQERSQVENFFMRSPRRREQLGFAAALGEALGEPNTARVVTTTQTDWWSSIVSLFRPGWAMLATATAALLVVLSAWLWIQNGRLNRSAALATREKEDLVQKTNASQDEAEKRVLELERQIASLKAEGGDLKSQIAAKEKELESLKRAGAKSTANSSTTVAFILSPGLTRGNDEPEKLVIPSSATNLRLQLDLEHPGNYQHYLAEIRTARGNLVWSKSDLSLRKTGYGQAIFLSVPASLLLNGEYEVTLKGMNRSDAQALGYYYLIVLHRQ